MIRRTKANHQIRSIRFKAMRLLAVALLVVAAGAKGYTLQFGHKPGFLTIDPEGNLYVIAGIWQSVEKVSPNGRDLGPFIAGGLRPSSIAFDKGGNCYAMDHGTVTRISTTGRHLSEFSVTDRGKASMSLQPSSGGFYGAPYTLAVDSLGSVYVSYYDSGNIDRFDASGKYLGVFVTLQGPAHKGMAFDSAGNLYVVNATTNSVEKVSPDGADLGEFVGGNLENPEDLVIDGSGKLYIRDASGVKKFSSEGKYLGEYPGMRGGGFSMEPSRGLAVDHVGNVYITDFWDGTVEKFSADGKDLGVFATDGQRGHAW